MTEWSVRLLSELTENLDARRVPIKEADRRSGPYPYYGASGIVDHVDDYLFEGLHLLIAEDGENLRTRKLPIAFLAEGRFWVNNHAHIVRGNREADTRFLLYALLTADVTSYLSGSTMPKLTQGNLNRIPIFAPDKRHQQVVASVLGALDDKIELNRRMNETLEATARAIFKDWFVDFGPTRAKMEGRAPYLAADIWSLFPDTLDDDGKPTGWVRVPLATLIEVNPPEPLPRGKDAPYLDMASIPTTGSNPEPYVLREFGSGMRFRNGDALLARITPCLENGKTAFVHNLPQGEVGWGSTEFIVLRSRPPIPKPVAYLLARDKAFRASAIRSMTGTSGRQRASHDAVSAYPMIQPDNDDLWRKLGGIVDPMFERIAANDAESQTIATTRDFLLPKLMSGEIRVREAEKAVEVAV
jgi:type I restriction enzyme S subunit